MNKSYKHHTVARITRLKTVLFSITYVKYLGEWSIGREDICVVSRDKSMNEERMHRGKEGILWVSRNYIVMKSAQLWIYCFNRALKMSMTHKLYPSKSAYKQINHLITLLDVYNQWETFIFQGCQVKYLRGTNYIPEHQTRMGRRGKCKG